jgi:hypothetical protein
MGLTEGSKQTVALAAKYRTPVPIDGSLGDFPVCGQESRIAGSDTLE